MKFHYSGSSTIATFPFRKIRIKNIIGKLRKIFNIANNNKILIKRNTDNKLMKPNDMLERKCIYRIQLCNKFKLTTSSQFSVSLFWKNSKAKLKNKFVQTMEFNFKDYCSSTSFEIIDITKTPKKKSTFIFRFECNDVMIFRILSKGRIKFNNRFVFIHSIEN